MALLKQFLEDGEISLYSWIEGSEIVADVFTKASKACFLLFQSFTDY